MILKLEKDSKSMHSISSNIDFSNGRLNVNLANVRSERVKYGKKVLQDQKTEFSS